MEGMNCAFTGTIVGEPVLKMVKNGTLPLLTLTVVFAESNGTTITRVNRFGDQAKDLSEVLACGRMVQVEGIVSLNTWIKDGVPKSGFCVTARSIRLVE